MLWTKCSINATRIWNHLAVGFVSTRSIPSGLTANASTTITTPSFDPNHHRVFFRIFTNCRFNNKGYYYGMQIFFLYECFFVQLSLGLISVRNHLENLEASVKVQLDVIRHFWLITLAILFLFKAFVKNFFVNVILSKRFGEIRR